ncbi:hypothetical protein PEX1_106960 [Penicillium expansum]|nr:hypothetical protein PEX1_106960 [Penicillium expansum]
MSFLYSSSDSNATSGNLPFPIHTNGSRPSDPKTEPPEIIKELVTSSITEEQLIHDVNEMYARLCIAENQCTAMKKQTQSRAELLQTQWRELFLLHQKLLDEYVEFFLTTRDPSANPKIRNLAKEYSIPQRMWRYGVLSFLEPLRNDPSLGEFMFGFIYLSYSTIALLLENIPDFRETWIGCLGDLARYRMGVEAFDEKDRRLWAEISRCWYTKALNLSPEHGRIQHHLGILARPDILRQFFHFTRALTSVKAFPDALDSITKLVTPLMNVPAKDNDLVTLFVTMHGALFMKRPVEEFISRANVFLDTLRNEISKLDRHGQQGVQLTSCNISAIFKYGGEYGVMETDSTLELRNTTAEDRRAAMKWASNASSAPLQTKISPQLTFRASSLAFHTLIVMLGQLGDPNMYPSVHISMAFIWYLTLNPAAIQRLEPLIPWSLLSTYLNTLFNSETIISKIEDESFPLLNDIAIQPLPEDLLVRGEVWSRIYYPENFFEGATTEENTPSMERNSIDNARKLRCLWLGMRIARVCLPFYS